VDKGTQIAYIPRHANGDIHHKDVEFGFVMSVTPGGLGARCRYWRKNEPGQLKTVANSELTALTDLVEHNSVFQYIVDNAIKSIENDR